MNQQIASFLEDPSVCGCIKYYSNRLAKWFPNSLDREDAEQELKIWLIERITKYYKPEISCRATFTLMVLKSYMVATLRSKKHHMLKFNETVNRTLINYVDPAIETTTFKESVKADFDMVSADLRKCKNRYAVAIFDLMRTGCNKSDCAFILDVSPAYVGRIIKRIIREVFNKYDLHRYITTEE